MRKKIAIALCLVVFGALAVWESMPFSSRAVVSNR